MRSLASVQKVTEVRPIDGADAIEAVKVLGWWVVVKKVLGIVPNDLVVYFEIDSVLPDLPEFSEMLRGKPWSPRAARLKTVTLRGQRSQGYVRPVRDLAQYIPNIDALSPGDDVTDVLGVIKYEEPEPSDTATLAGHWIPGVPRTDELRIQSNPGLLHRISFRPFIATVKMDGTSGTFGLDADGVFWECSRKFRLVPGDHPHGLVARRYYLKDVVAENPHLVIQGEVCGPKIQNNRLNLTSPDLFVFDVWDKRKQDYLSPNELAVFCTEYGLTRAPVALEGRSFIYTIEQMLDLADGLYPGTENPREGLVFRSNDSGERVSFKVISNVYLDKGGS